MFSHVLTIFLYKKNEGIRLEGIKISKGIIYHKFLYKVLLENWNKDTSHRLIYIFFKYSAHLHTILILTFRTNSFKRLDQKDRGILFRI